MNKKGMSLAVLVVTIVVLLILVATVIMNLNDYHTIDKADESTFKNDMLILQDELNSYIIEKENELATDFKASELNVNINSADSSKLKDIMPSITDYYKQFVFIKNGKIYIKKANVDSALQANYEEWSGEIGILVEQ